MVKKKQPKNHRTNKQTNKQTKKPNSTTTATTIALQICFQRENEHLYFKVVDKIRILGIYFENDKMAKEQ